MGHANIINNEINIENIHMPCFRKKVEKTKKRASYLAFKEVNLNY
ncbi:hypothetical protein PSKAS_08260 [Peribacillus sp. N1]